MAKRSSIQAYGATTPISTKRRKVDHPPKTPEKSTTDTPSKQRSILKRKQDVDAGEATPKSVRKVLFASTGPDRIATRPSTENAANDKDGTLTNERKEFVLRNGLDGERDRVQENAADGSEEARDLEPAQDSSRDHEDQAEDEEQGDIIRLGSETPSSVGKLRGRRKRRRSPTPPQDLPPHELYFFQNRPGGSKTSSNTLPSSQLLKHEEYFAKIEAYQDPHDSDKRHLALLHSRGFDQWMFELEEGFNICLYGYGSKRSLVMDFVEHLYSRRKRRIIVVNGYSPSLDLKEILNLLCRNLLPPSQHAKLPAQASALQEVLLAHLEKSPPKSPIVLVVHSIDAHPVRRAPVQSALAQIAARTSISLLATADTLTFPLMWDISVRDRLRFLFHDVTTFEPYSAEVHIVEDVNILLGRSGRSISGKDGVEFVLQSLPENARNLFKILIAEQLALGESHRPAQDLESIEEDEEVDALLGFDEELGEAVLDTDPATPTKSKRGRKPKQPKKSVVASRGVDGVEHRTLYHKAVEEFVCSSEMGFRTLLKEFHDHQMVESRKDALGTETLSVPFAREELEVLLEELV